MKRRADGPNIKSTAAVVQVMIKALFSLGQLWSTLPEVLPKRNILMIRAEAIRLNLNEKVLKIKMRGKGQNSCWINRRVLNILNICCLNKFNIKLKHSSVFLFLHVWKWSGFSGPVWSWWDQLWRGTDSCLVPTGDSCLRPSLPQYEH